MNSPAPSQPIFSNRNFLTFWIGTLHSVIGDQISQIAIAWLVYQQTGNVLALGTVLAIGSIPKGVIILCGGVLTDRFDARRVLVLSRVLSFVLLAAFATLVHMNLSTLPIIYAFAALSGLISAFSMPSGNAILPRIVEEDQLLAGNGLLMSTMQLGQIFGPMIAGVLIFIFGSADGKVDHNGLALCFYADSLTFLVSYLSLLMVKLKPLQVSVSSTQSSKFSDEFADGFRYLWNDLPLRMFVFYMGVINLLVVGPIIVGLPVFIDKALSLGGGSYGAMASVYGIGSFIGSLLPQFFRVSKERLGISVLGLDCVIGIFLALFSMSTSMMMASTFLCLMGMLGGYVMTTIFTWIQTRILPQYMGRIMSFVLFAVVGLLACFEHLEVEEFIGCLKKMSEVLDPECKIIGTVPRPPVKPILEALAFFGFISRTLVADHKFYYDRTTLAATVARGGWKLSKYESFQFGFNSMFILERDPAYNID